MRQRLTVLMGLLLFVLATPPVMADSVGRTLADYLPKWGFNSFWQLEIWQWLGIGAAIFLGLVVKVIVRYLVSFIHRVLAKKTETEWDDRIIEAFRGPTAYVGAIGFWILSLTLLGLPQEGAQVIEDILQFILGIVLIWMGYRLVNVFIDFVESVTSKTESNLDDQLIPILSKTLKSLVVVIGGMIVLQNIGINVLSLLAGLGIGGLAFALAARDTAANLFGSLTIFSDRPFMLGDWVKIGSEEGIVEEIGLRTTRLRTFAYTLISIPNATVANSHIVNISKRGNFRRVYKQVGLTYDTPPEKMEAFLEGVKNAILAHPKTHKKGFHVAFVNYGQAGLDIMIYFFLDVADWGSELMSQQQVMIEIMRIAREVGVRFAYPTQTLHVETFPGQEPSASTGAGEPEKLKQTAAAFAQNGKLSRPGGMGIFQPPYK